MTYTGPREQAILWQQQPAGVPFDWAQVLGEILPPAIGGPLPPAQQPTALLVTHGASARLSRPEVVRLADALRVWLARTSWSAELPAAPEVDELLTHDDHPDCALCGHPHGPHTPVDADGRGSCVACVMKYMPAQQCPGYSL